jgi:hypothetical protein
MAKLKDGYNSMCTMLFHQTACETCDLCKPLGEVACLANQIVMTSVQNMCDQILYPKGATYEFHKLKCIQGDFFACGISTLQVYLKLTSIM